MPKNWYWNNLKHCHEYRKKYYQSHKEHEAKARRLWNLANWERVKAKKKAWREANREKVLEGKRRSWYRCKLKAKLDIWIQEVGREVLKSDSDRICPVCGMETRAVDLYIFDNKYFCFECLKDFKETSLIPRVKFVLEKVRCPKCGREHPDKRFKNVCIDCRVKKKRKEVEKHGGFLGLATYDTPLEMDI